jgi:hypothetical protein
MNTKFTLITTILCWLTILNGFCQEVICEGDVILKSQAEVNAFNCTEITGGLFISGADITDLSPLQNLRKVGSLSIWENVNLTNVDGLSGLREISEISGFPYTIGIVGNPSLKNLDGLGYLTMDSLGPINISNNPLLESINAFSSPKTAFGLFSISNNASLKSINGFQNLTDVRNYGFEPFIMIDNNASLTSINGFSSLQRISGNGANLQISNNTALTSIDGFSSLVSISGGGRGAGLFIENNGSLTNIDGFSSLSVLGYGVAGVITVNNNVKLANVDGLSSVKISQGNFRLTVTNNTSLTNCQGLFPMMASYGLLDVSAENFRISGNGSGCTLEDIIANGMPAVGGFATYNKVTGTLNSLYQNTANYNLADPNFRNYILQANTPSSVKSVEFKINGNSTFLDNTAPFQLDIQSLTPGRYTIVAEPYSEPNKKGQKGTSSTAYVTIDVGASLNTFEIVHTSGSFIKYLFPDTRINLKDPAFSSFNIRSTANPERVNSVKFWLNGVLVNTERVYPYLLAGDPSNGTYYPWKPKPGKYTLRAVPYIVHNNVEYAGTPNEVVFYIDDVPTIQVLNFDVVDTSGKILKQLRVQNDTINLADPAFKNFTFVANTQGLVKSVRLRFDNQPSIVENVVPYVATGDNNGYFNPWKATTGNHRISAIPYYNVGGTGDKGYETVLRFTVINKPANISSVNNLQVSAYPVPMKNNLTVEVKNSGAKFSVILKNNQGRTVHTGSYDAVQSQTYSINTLDLPSGIYFLQLQDSNGIKKVIRVTK